MKQVWNKLVRDNVPTILSSKGIIVELKTLDKTEYAAALDDKIFEEAQEFIDNHALFELVDLLEVVHAQAKLHGYSLEELEATRKAKALERGNFDEKLFLISTDE